jgi:hypothetical protein
MKKQITINPVNKDPNQKKRRNPIKYTKLFLTINTNIVYKPPNGQASLDAFTEGLKGIFENIEDYIEFTSGKPEWEKIENIKATVSPEVGPLKKTIHAHALVIIHHRSSIRLSYARIKQELVDSGAVPASGFHFYSKVIKDNLQNVEDYIHKHRGELLEEGPEDFSRGNKRAKIEAPEEEENFE